MVRERFDDELDDDRDSPRLGDRPSRRYDRAGDGANLKMPGLALILLSLPAMLVSGTFLFMTVQPPRQVLNFIHDRIQVPLLEMQPDGQAKTDALEQVHAQRDRAIAQAGDEPRPTSIALWSGNLLGSIIMLAGGIAMRGRKNYPVAMAGSIFALIPVTTGCACFSTAFGIWALIALSGSRNAFRRSTAPTDLADDLDR